MGNKPPKLQTYPCWDDSKCGYWRFLDGFKVPKGAEGYSGENQVYYTKEVEIRILGCVEGDGEAHSRNSGFQDFKAGFG